MRLINTATLQLEEFFDKEIPEYAILSHTWGQNEVVLADYEQRVHRKRKRKEAADDSVSKIRNCCWLAAEEGHRYAWIDTCCIDKKSSAELSEAINSMFRWYQNAQICYVYLGDVSKQSSWDATADLIRKARWFTRGWTLQELLAPRTYKFYDCDWKFLGGRLEHQDVLACSSWQPIGGEAFSKLISRVTNINHNIIRFNEKLSNISVAEIMSWAADRVTTRREDMAYCLLGLFGVNMPLLYGEGDNAFARLQNAIIESTDDHTIFAWDYGIHASISWRHDSPRNTNCLAQSPSDFKNGYQLSHIARDDIYSGTSIALHYSLTNLGIHITLRVIDLPHLGGTMLLAVLACRDKRLPWPTNNPHVVAIPLCRSSEDSILFRRIPVQTRPLLLHATQFHGSRDQMMYIQSINEYPHVDSNELSCVVGGMKMTITERYPYFVSCFADVHEDHHSSKQPVAFSVDMDEAPFSFEPPTNSVITIGLKFDTPPADALGHGSIFILVQYLVQPRFGEYAVKGFGLVSGDGWPSLTSFMLNDATIRLCLATPTQSITLHKTQDCNASKRVCCRQIETDEVGVYGGDIFVFCLEDS